MHILRISDSMNIEDVYTYPFNCKHLYFLCTANNSNGLTIGGGHMPVSGDVRDLHFFSFNNHWELTHQKTYDFYPGDGIYGLTSCNDTIYASVHTNSVNNTRDNIWRLETDLEYTIIGQPYNNTRYSTITNDFNNDLILSGMTSEYNGGVSQDYISNFRMSTSGENKENIQYGVSGVRDKSSPYGGISASENRIFCISMEGSGDGIIEWFSPFPVKARLTVMDYNFNELSESYLDDDACYISCKIVVTSDGGCIFIASRYDYQAGNLERDLVVVKTDPNGIFTWTTEISLPDLPNGIYPNPANEYIHIKKQFIPGLLQIFDINGKPILETEAKSTVDISNLVSGNYVYRIVNEKGIVTSAGKMIVE